MGKHTLGASDPSIIARLNLSKMMKFVTVMMGGDGYLNFMGNEFSHPEWVEFPEPRNGYSYDKCRRQWNLIDPIFDLIFRDLLYFDQCLMNFVKEHMPMQYYVGINDNNDTRFLDFNKGENYRFFVNLTSQTIKVDVEARFRDFFVVFNSVDSKFGPVIDQFDQQGVYHLEDKKLKVVLHGYSFFVVKLVN